MDLLGFQEAAIAYFCKDTKRHLTG